LQEASRAIAARNVLPWRTCGCWSKSCKDRTKMQGGNMSANPSSNNPHPHKYTIADDEAVRTLMTKLAESSHQTTPELQKALETAMEEYQTTDDQQRKAFFHGMLTGYGVALQAGQKFSSR
jgi:hypothetical protein